MSEERPKRRRRRGAKASESDAPAEPDAASEAGAGEPGEEARSAEEGPVAPQAGVEEARSEEAQSADEGPVAPQAGVDDEPAASDEAGGEPGPSDDADEEPAPTYDEPSPTEGAAPGDDPAPADKPARRRRRGSAETGAGRRRSAPRRDVDGDVVVRAHARYVRCAPRKARLVVEHIRGKRVDEARAILRHTPRHAARDVLKLLESCVSNAENNHELVADELVVHQAYVDEGPTIRRYRPRAYGRATRINKRTSHMTVTLTPRTSKE